MRMAMQITRNDGRPFSLGGALSSRLTRLFYESHVVYELDESQTIWSVRGPKQALKAIEEITTKMPLLTVTGSDTGYDYTREDELTLKQLARRICELTEEIASIEK